MYRQRIADLQQILADASDSAFEAEIQQRELIRALIDHITIRPLGQDPEAAVEIILHGRLAALMENGETLLNQASDALVAGGGIEPPT